MVPVGWNIESTKLRRTSVLRADGPPLDRGEIRLYRVYRVERGAREGRLRRGLAWSTEPDGLRLVEFPPDEEDPASPECFEIAHSGRRETWCFGGAAEIALGLVA